MGSSTALHLARRGFTDIQVLDVWESPSADSAGNDINKVSQSWGQVSTSPFEDAEKEVKADLEPCRLQEQTVLVSLEEPQTPLGRLGQVIPSSSPMHTVQARSFSPWLSSSKIVLRSSR